MLLSILNMKIIFIKNLLKVFTLASISRVRILFFLQDKLKEKEENKNEPLKKEVLFL